MWTDGRTQASLRALICYNEAMTKPTLYLFIGYPGAGKTKTAKIIAAETGAKHLWADYERHKLFPKPTHSREESDQLYDQLNEAAEYLLAQGKSVVYDTNFNYYADRQKLRQIAARRGAETRIIWINTPIDIARDRAVCSDKMRNGYLMNMTDAEFTAIASKLQPPRKDEKIIKIDGTKIDKAAVIELLKR